MPIKYSYELLNNFCNEKKIKLIDDYTNEKLFGSSKIKFYCTKCDNENVKCFTYLIKRNTLCKRCITIESFPKQKETMMKKYGVEHPSKSDDIKNKIKEGFIKKWGVDNPSKTDIVKNKIKTTCLKKYGVEYLVNNKTIREKMKKTCLEKYGVDNVIKNQDIKAKIKTTCLEKYGVDNPGKSIDFQEKMKQTMVKKYGVEFPLQNDIIAESTIKKCFKQKEFTFPSGKIIKCQGYEPFALNDLLSKYNEEQLVTGCKNVPKLWYLDNDGNKHRHFVDIYIPDLNLCIEVKSNWTFKYKTECIYKKQEYAKLDGYNYEIWIYNNKGNKIETII
jgi:hypothetical protein